MTAQIDLKGGSYSAKSIIADAQRCVNVYPEKNPEGSPTPFTYYPRYGLKSVVAAMGPAPTPIPTPCVIGGVHFDGNTALLCAALTADAGDTVTAVSFWAKTVRAGNTVYEYAISNPDTTGHTVPNMTFLQVSNASGGTPCQAIQQWDPNTQLNILGANWPEDEGNNIDGLGDNSAQWMHFLIQLNSTGGRPGAMLVNGLDYQYSAGNFQSIGADTINGLSGLPFWVGGSGEGTDTDEDYLVGDMAEFWLSSGTDLLEMDGTFSADTVAKFIGPGNAPVFLGEQGETPTGTQATIYLHRCTTDDASAFMTNHGSGGDFTAFSGGIIASDTDPQGAQPKPVGPFEITGTPTVGSALSVSGSWLNSPSGVTYQWWSLNLGTVLATTPTYTPLIGDVGDSFWVIAVATNGAGSTFVDTSVGITDAFIYFGPIT